MKEIKIPKCEFAERFNIQMRTKFWDEIYTIEVTEGMEAVGEFARKNFNRLLKANNYKDLTELVMVINWHCWRAYYKHQAEVSTAYSDLYYELDSIVLESLNGEALTYYIRTTD